MNKKIALSAAIILTVTMLVSLYLPVQATTSYGARNSCEFVWYPAGVDTSFAALQAGQIDMLDWALTREQKVAAEGNPNLQLVQYSSFSLWELDINNNKTIKQYGSGATSATAIPQVRQAIACLIDKPTAIIANILEYYGVQIDEPVVASSTAGWTNTSYEGVNYPYKQNYTKAVDYLASVGFWGDGTWLYYPNATWTTVIGGTTYTGAQIWGTSAGKTTQDVAGGQPLVVSIRNTDPLRLAVGLYVEAQLDGGSSGPTYSALYGNPEWAIWGAAHGEPGLKGGAFGTTGTTYSGPRTMTSPQVMGDRNYNLYTGGWTVGRYPATYEFFLFSTLFWYSYGPNYVTGDTWAIGNPHYSTTQDTYLHNTWYAPTMADSIGNCTLFTGYWVEYCENIMLWTSASYNAWYKGLEGVVNEQGAGIINDYTFLNAYKTGSRAGTPIIVGEPETWTIINPMYSEYVFEWDYLGRIVSSTINVNPYSVVTDQPWIAQDWSVGTWFDARTNLTKTAVTYWFRQDCGWVAPVTGTFGGYFNAKDFAANMWYTYAYDTGWNWASTMDINHISIVNNYTATVYFDDYSIWFLYEPTFPIMMPMNALTTNTQLCASRTVTFYGSNLTTPAGALPGYTEYAFTTDSVVSVISATKNGNPLTQGVDYYIRAGYDVSPVRSVFVPITAVASTDTITITYYYAIPSAASGTYLGSNLVGSSGVPASLWSCSYVYPTSLSTTTSYLAVNPYFFMQVPLLGEINWNWVWTGTTQPRSGYYRIDILDVVKCTSSYSHRGDGTYDPVYFPGADLSGSDLCHVGILSLVSITGKYYQTFGTPRVP